MFDLEKSISDWRRQMLTSGIKTPVPLEELENHLREDVEEQMRLGATAQLAFATTVKQIGRGEVLRTEFAKVGETIYERLKRHFYAFAGIPDYQLAMNMNTSNSNLEPGWATYFKTAAFIVPAIAIWVGTCVLIVPKLKEICEASGVAISKPVVSALVFSDFIKRNLIVGFVLILTALVLAEWRSQGWRRYRRLVFGILAFSLNLIALILMATLCLCAVVAGANLLAHHG